jgi:hypothetical protein
VGNSRSHRHVGRESFWPTRHCYSLVARRRSSRPITTTANNTNPKYCYFLSSFVYFFSFPRILFAFSHSVQTNKRPSYQTLGRSRFDPIRLDLSCVRDWIGRGWRYQAPRGSSRRRAACRARRRRSGRPSKPSRGTRRRMSRTAISATSSHRGGRSSFLLVPVFFLRGFLLARRMCLCFRLITRTPLRILRAELFMAWIGTWDLTHFPVIPSLDRIYAMA